MTKKEIQETVQEAVRETLIEMRKEGDALLCSAGLSLEQVEVVNQWTIEGGFTDSQMDALKAFADTLHKGKKYFLIGFGIVIILALKDVWELIWNWLVHHLKIG